MIDVSIIYYKRALMWLFEVTIIINVVDSIMKIDLAMVLAIINISVYQNHKGIHLTMVLAFIDSSIIIDSIKKCIINHYCHHCHHWQYYNALQRDCGIGHYWCHCHHWQHYKVFLRALTWLWPLLTSVISFIDMTAVLAIIAIDSITKGIDIGYYWCQYYD